MKKKIVPLILVVMNCCSLLGSGCATEPDEGLKSTDPQIDTATETSTEKSYPAEPQAVTSYELHGRAGFPKVPVFHEPDMQSPQLGYLLKGTRVRLGDPKYHTEECEGGWYKLAEGGFVCRGRGILVGKKPRYIPRVPPKPLTDQLDPYQHGFIRFDWTPQYKRLPTLDGVWHPPMKERDTEAEAEEKRAQAAAKEAERAAAEDEPSATTEGEGGVDKAAADEADAGDESPAEDVVSDPEPPTAGTKLVAPVTTDDSAPEPEVDTDTATGEVIPHSENREEGTVDYYRYTKRKFRRVRTLLNRGFWVSVVEKLYHDESKNYYYETVDGDFVPGNNVHLIKPPSFQGYEVTGDNPLPAAIVTDPKATFFSKRKNGFRRAGRVRKYEVYRVLETIKSRGASYYKIKRDRWLKSGQVAFFDVRKMPEEVPKGIGLKDKWILVDLSRQTIEAYEGMAPVYVTLISSGLPGNEETETPKGTFHINYKHLTDDMVGSVGGEDAYSVDDVPWVQYFNKSVAFHAAFWHSKYGRPRSHGCINMAPADARWLFEWSGPVLPDDWHGVVASDNNPGTLVIVRGKTPVIKKPWEK